MTPEQKQIKIAEICGKFKEFETKLGSQWRSCFDENFNHIDSFGHILGSALPDYLNDLNACHEMENTLGKWTDCLKTKIEQDYTENLINITTQDDTWYAHATASQRCDAFLMTHGVEI
jgi:hypothetical protein